MQELTVRQARRLALVRGGLLRPEWTGLCQRAGWNGRLADRAAQSVISRFGYLQLDTVAVAGARSHALVLLSRLENLDPQVPERLLRPGQPLFEYWGHEASWLPLDLYPVFDFRRREFSRHPWWGDLVGEHPRVAEALVERIRVEGPLRTLDMEGRGGRGWWDLKLTKKVATALWSSGRLAIRERRNFQRTFDLAERVIPDHLRTKSIPRNEAIRELLLVALSGHGWATTGTLARTWRLRNCRDEIDVALAELVNSGAIIPCAVVESDRRRTFGWLRREDLELADRVDRMRPRSDQGVLLSPFDPALWDRGRVECLFGFHQVLEIFKPADERIYGYFCLPVLAGDRLVARVDLKADVGTRALRVLSCRFEAGSVTAHRAAARRAIERHAAALEFAVDNAGLPD